MFLVERAQQIFSEIVQHHLQYRDHLRGLIHSGLRFHFFQNSAISNVYLRQKKGSVLSTQYLSSSCSLVTVKVYQPLLFSVPCMAK